MATLRGDLPDIGKIYFEIDGLATYEQMQKLLEYYKKVNKSKGLDAKTLDSINKKLDDTVDNFEDLNKVLERQEKTTVKSEKSRKKLEDAVEDLEDGISSLAGVSKGATGTISNVPIAFRQTIGEMNVKMAAATSALTGWVVGLGDAVQAGLQMGIAGGVMDFAIAAKTAGVNLQTFTTALQTTGGSFAALGGNATQGAKQFAALVSSVRTATASVGNLGLSNEELADLTAKQTKIAVSQGLKGISAQNSVIKNTFLLANEVDALSNATGKSVKAILDAAAQLATDPSVAAYVKIANKAGKDVSTSVQLFAANLNSVFGKVGDTIAADALKTAMSGLPLSITSAGQNMLLASSTMYAELEKQGREAASGIRKTADQQEEDRRRLAEIAKREVETNGETLIMFQNMGGNVGEAAKQILTMAMEAEQYNTNADKRRREEDRVAKEFNASLNQFQANLKALAIPFMNLINGIDWTMFISVLSGVAKAVEILLTPLSWLGKILGDTGLGMLIGIGAALGTVFYQLATGAGILGKMFTSLKTVVGSTKTGLSNFIDKINNFKLTVKGSTPTDPLAGLRALGSRQRLPGASSDITGGGAAYIKGRDAAEKTLVTFKKFSPAILGATTALSGLGLAAIGRNMLEEDANSTLGKVLETTGEIAEYVGTWGGIIGQLYGPLKDLLPKFGAFKNTISLVTTVLSGFATTLGRAAMAMIAPLVSGAVALWGFISPLLVAAAPFIALGAAVAALGAGIWYFRDEIKEAASWVGKQIGKLWDLITKPFTTFWDWMKNSFIGKMLGLGDDKKETINEAGKREDSKKIRENETREHYIGRRAREMVESGEVKPRTNSTNSKNAAYNKARLQAMGDYENLNTAQVKDNKYVTISRPVDEPAKTPGTELVNTQRNAVNEVSFKEQESVQQQRKTNQLLESLVGNSEVQTNIQAQTARNSEDTSRYARQTALNQS